MHKNAQKMSEKLRTKFPATAPSCSMIKIGPLFLKCFLTASKPSKRSITAAKRKEKEKKGREKKFSKF